MTLRGLRALTRFSSDLTPNSFNAPLTVGQASCKYFSDNDRAKTHGWETIIENVADENNETHEPLKIEIHSFYTQFFQCKFDIIWAFLFFSFLFLRNLISRNLTEGKGNKTLKRLNLNFNLFSLDPNNGYKQYKILYFIPNPKYYQSFWNFFFFFQRLIFTGKQTEIMMSMWQTSVLREEGGEGADFEHAALVPRRVELVDFPVIDGRVIPWLWLVVLSLVLRLLLPLYFNFAVALLQNALVHRYSPLLDPTPNLWLGQRASTQKVSHLQ